MVLDLTRHSLDLQHRRCFSSLMGYSTPSASFVPHFKGLCVVPVLPDGPSVTSRMLNGLDEFMATRGLDLAEHAKRVGIDTRVADDPDGFLDFAAVLTLFENAATESGDDAFGLHFAAFCPLCPIGLYHYVISNAPQLREALKVRVRFSKLVVSAYDVSFEEDDDSGYYIWNGPDQLGPRRQFLDYVVTLLVERIRIMLSEASWMPLSVSFQHAAPKSMGEFSRVLGRNLRFDAPRSCVAFDKASLDRNLPAADSILFKELQRIAERVPSAPARPQTLPDKVRRLLVASFPRDGESQGAIANQLGLSVRALQRTLANSGTTFEVLRDDTRKRAAYEYITDTDIPLTEIAFLLGFSELSVFSRAARTWFGEAASNLRRRARIGQATSG